MSIANDSDSLVLLRRYDSALSAEMAKSCLMGSDIQSSIFNGHYVGLQIYSPWVPVELRVRQMDYEKANDLLAAAEGQGLSPLNPFSPPGELVDE